MNMINIYNIKIYIYIQMIIDDRRYNNEYKCDIWSSTSKLIPPLFELAQMLITDTLITIL